MRILVVDDDPVVLDLVAEQLGEHGFSVMIAGGVEAALEVLGGEPPALILTDIRMAPRDGYALLEEVRGRSPQVPVVLMSSFSPPGTAESASQAGAAGFLKKPFTEQQVVEAVAGALRDHGPPRAPDDTRG